MNANGSLNTTYGTNGVALLPGYVSGPLLLQSDGKVLFASYGSIDRTTAPTPVVFPAPVLVTTGTGKKTKVSGVTAFFNTAVDPGMASNVKIYQVRIGTKGRKYIKVKRATYNATNNSVLLQFAKPAKLNNKGYTITFLASTGIVGVGSPILNGGAAYSVYVPPTATTT